MFCKQKNEVRDNYSSPNSAAKELFPVSDVRNERKKWDQAENKTAMQQAEPMNKEWKTLRTVFG